MRKLYIGLVLSFIMGLGTFLYYTKPCFAGFCTFKGKCFNSSICGVDCVCVSDKDLDLSGYCLSTVNLKSNMIILE